MSNRTHTLLKPYRFLARILLYSVVLFVAAFVPAAVPCIGLLVTAESEAPLDVCGSSEEAAISVQARAQIRRQKPLSPLRFAANRHARIIVIADTDCNFHSGHRLANNFLAPLRC